MVTVKQLAERHGVSVAFVIAALAQGGFNAAGPDAPLPPGVVSRFAETWGHRIRMKRPKPPPEFQGVSDIALPTAAAAARAARTPPKRIMRIAHARVTGGRDSQGNKVKKLLDNPGPVHAIDPIGTWDGDPWRGVVVPGGVHFYDGGPKSGPRSACGYTNVRAVLGEEFVPAEDPERAGQCPKCAEAVRAGRGWRTSPHEREERRLCDQDLRLVIKGRRVVEFCIRRDYHLGRHRSDSGATWLEGPEDYEPAITAGEGADEL